MQEQLIASIMVISRLFVFEARPMINARILPPCCVIMHYARSTSYRKASWDLPVPRESGIFLESYVVCPHATIVGDSLEILYVSVGCRPILKGMATVTIYPTFYYLVQLMELQMYIDSPRQLSAPDIWLCPTRGISDSVQLAAGSPIFQVL